MNKNLPTLLVISGPTAVGKTGFAIDLALLLHTEIISCDSRQFFKELNIGTAKPSQSELSRVKHHFIGQLSVHDYYNISIFEAEVQALLHELFLKYKVVLMVGGSGLYIYAVCKGVDRFPDPSEELRQELKSKLRHQGIDSLRMMLEMLDPVYYQQVDLNNPNRLLRALEVCISSGRAYSSLRVSETRERPFNIVKIGLNLPREILFDRISQRVDQMMQDGLLEEVKVLTEYQHLNALNTVGYKELFRYLAGEVSLEQAVTDIKTNTRRYAKRQLTWMRRDNEYSWFRPDQQDEIAAFIKQQIELP